MVVGSGPVVLDQVAGQRDRIGRPAVRGVMFEDVPEGRISVRSAQLTRPVGEEMGIGNVQKSLQRIGLRSCRATRTLADMSLHHSRLRSAGNGFAAADRRQDGK